MENNQNQTPETSAEKFARIKEEVTPILKFNKYKIVKTAAILGFIMSFLPAILCEVIVGGISWKMVQYLCFTALPIYIVVVTLLTVRYTKKHLPAMSEEGIAFDKHNMLLYSITLLVVASIIQSLLYMVYAGGDNPSLYPLYLLGHSSINIFGILESNAYNNAGWISSFRFLSFLFSVALAFGMGYLATYYINKKSQE